MLSPRSPDPTKESVRILEKYSDVWRREKGSIDLRVKAHAFLSLRRYFPECSVVISDLEDHVQRAEAMMFPAKKAEEEAWIQDVLNEVLPSKVGDKSCMFGKLFLVHVCCSNKHLTVRKFLCGNGKFRILCVLGTDIDSSLGNMSLV